MVSHRKPLYGLIVVQSFKASFNINNDPSNNRIHNLYSKNTPLGNQIYDQGPWFMGHLWRTNNRNESILGIFPWSWVPNGITNE